MPNLLSVIVAVHNKAAYIEFFINQLREVTGDAEFILVDDGSDDGTGEILKRQADSFLRLENVWETFSNNAALEIAKGDYVAIVQDDDLVFSQDWLRQSCRFMEEQSIDILGGRGYGATYVA